MNSPLPFDICCAFFCRQKINFNKNWDKENYNINKKIDNLRSANVILNLKDYNDKMYEILSDKNTYK